MTTVDLTDKLIVSKKVPVPTPRYVVQGRDVLGYENQVNVFEEGKVSEVLENIRQNYQADDIKYATEADVLDLTEKLFMYSQDDGTIVAEKAPEAEIPGLDDILGQYASMDEANEALDYLKQENGVHWMTYSRHAPPKPISPKSSEERRMDEDIVSFVVEDYDNISDMDALNEHIMTDEGLQDLERYQILYGVIEKSMKDTLKEYLETDEGFA